MNLNFKKFNGLVPTIIQDSKTRQMLMLGFMNREAYQKTRRTGKVWFFSRTKKRLWKKGEASGNELQVVRILMDCDHDALLIKAKPAGPACHTGEVSCFKDEGDELRKLFEVIKARKRTMSKKSYTASLFRAGLNKICAKVSEESAEVIQAAQKETRQRLIEESADLLYHLFVLWVEKGITAQAIEDELIRRRKG